MKEKRLSYLDFEKHCLENADRSTSSYLVEYMELETCYVIITDYVAGCDLWDLRRRYKANLNEIEARNII